MSKNLTQNAIQQFDADVKHSYQEQGKLRGTVRLKTGIVGTSHTFPKMGQGQATRRTPQTDVVPMNIAHTKAIATLQDWNAPEYTDIFDQQKVNYDERSELAFTIAGAIGRREDQLILDALDAASSTLTIAKTVGALDAMSTQKVRRAKKLLDDQGVPDDGMRTMAISAAGMEQLLGDAEASTFDKNVIKALFDGDIKKWVGFMFIQINTRNEGGLPISGTDRTFYAYHKSAVGMAVGIDFRTEVNYIAHKTSWLANGLFSAGSVGIDALGIVEGVYDEAIETPGP